MAKQKDKFHDIALKPVEISVDLSDREGKPSKGLKLNRHFTKKGKDIYADITWDKRTSIITDEKGNLISQINDLETPSTWSQLATDILAYKYLRKAGVPTPEGRETSAKQAVYRIAHSFADFGEKFGYFASKDDRMTFEEELSYLLITQRAAFNSPVWFNVGLHHQYGIQGQGGGFYWNFAEEKVLETETAYRNPQCSACFILAVRDSLPDIFELIKTESHIFKYGSGSGANFAPLRSRFEKLSGGGKSSGMMSFLKVFDRAADSVKSGGTTRRAAKMVVVDLDHPEIEDFINWKVREERKVQAMIEAGYPSDFNGEAYGTVSGQNSNNSVRVTDEFMKAVENDGEWSTRTRTNGDIYKTYKARELMDMIAKAAWQCADPGMQFDTTVNEWHTCPNTNRINASNPCSEYMFLDDSACNLASINVAKFVDEAGNFDIAGYRHACRTVFIGQEIAVDFSAYPTKAIAQNSHDYRPLGLGYANLGTLLMLRGVPYDSEQGRAIAGALTAIMCGHAYKTSAEIAAVKGPFNGYAKNRAPMLNVMRKHRAAAYRLDEKACPNDILEAARQDWDEAVALGEQFGYRNAQATVIAPTGTIGLLMDCDTTGIEPDFALVKYKKLAGGGGMKIVNNAVTRALANLGYTPEQQKDILTYALGNGTLNSETPINRSSLLAKGLTEDEIAAVERNLPAAFDIRHSFNRYVVGDAAMERLGVTSEDEADPGFSLLNKLGFSEIEIEQTNQVICGTQMLEGAPHLKEEHYQVFDCANKCGAHGTRFLSPMSHVKMMAAVQPFISGAISKTINMPHEATVEEVKDVYMQSWKLGVKAMALYRDGSKLSQPLNVQKKKDEDKPEAVETPAAGIFVPRRRRLPDERKAVTHKFNVGGHEGYLTLGFFEDGTLGEIFITMSKQGSLISGLMDAWAATLSVAMQYGVPASTWVRKFMNARFEPSGFTKNPQIRIAKSIIDYVARYIGLKCLTPEEQYELGLINEAPNLVSDSAPSVNTTAPVVEQVTQEEAAPTSEPLISPVSAPSNQAELPIVDGEKSKSSDAPICAKCGSLMRMKTGSCYTCTNCGNTSGGCG
ncbi:MAG: vitamin B12-dependent ribonucleotide reductase [Candidatus Berkelbacteria bacterium]|nr:MAG: vitamin B12-dependent ribonucleotide reductase [Candidatus Berkelbacteria bacterium]QQG51414.1 MAG: vitamin B12-dependent ribonucleotide reductase [Candidatus Berkelbacteria bacterium]